MDFKKVFKGKKSITVMKREVGVYLSVGILVAVGLFSLYFFDLGFTGFVVFDEAVSGFNGTFENVVYNGSAVVLSSGQASGTYTSEVFDANTSLQWNTIVWQGGAPNSTDNPVTNESGWINSTGYTLSGFDSSWSGITLTTLYDATDNSMIGLGNATVNSLSGVVTNATTNEWNNVLISYDYVSPFNASLSFQAKACSSSDCSDANFTGVDLSDLNLIGQYFQYRVDFSTSDSSLTPLLENVVINSSLGIVSINISEPTGEKSSQTGIPIQFTATGIGLICWYNIDGGENKTLEGCADSNFDVPDDGNYIFNLYVNNSLGASDYQSSSFLVDTPTPSSSSEESSESTGETQFVETVKLTADSIQSLTLNPNETKEISWAVRNVWTGSLQECNFESIGKFYTWINHTETVTLEAGGEHTFVFDVVVPEEIELGEYNLGVALKCPGTGKSILFTANVVEKTLGFELIDVQRVSEDEVGVVYSLEELSGSEQNIDLQFSLLDSSDNTVSELKENKTLSADSIEDFETRIPLNVSLISLGENESLEDSELTLLIDLDSEVYSFSVRERITLGAPVGFAIFGEGGILSTGNVLILVVFVLFLAGVFLVARHLRKGLSLSDLFKNLPFRKSP